MISTSYPCISSLPPSPIRGYVEGIISNSPLPLLWTGHRYHKIIWQINMHTAREQAREWIFHVTKHISRTYWLECAFPAVIGDWHERGGLRYGDAAALSTLPAAQGAQVVTVIACSARAWAEPQLGPGYLLDFTPSPHPGQPLREALSTLSTQPGISIMFVIITV